MAVGAVVSFRLLPPVLGLSSIGVGPTGLVLTAATWLLAGRRAKQTRRTLLGSSHPIPGGGLPLLLTLIATSAAAARPPLRDHGSAHLLNGAELQPVPRRQN
jgi:hypothetical protein